MSQLVHVLRTTDGECVVHVYADHTAKLWRGRELLAGGTIAKISEKLAEMGYGGDDLVPG